MLYDINAWQYKCQVWFIPINLASSCLDTSLRHSLSMSLSFFYNVWNAWAVKEASKNWSKGKFVEYASTLCPENINIYFYFQTAAGLAHKGRWIHVHAACFTAVSQSKSRMGRRSKRCNRAFRELSGGKKLKREKFLVAQTKLGEAALRVLRCVGRGCEPFEVYDLGEPVHWLTSLTKMATSSSSSVL